MNLNSQLHHKISSSEKRERCIIKMEQSDKNSRAKSRSDTPSSELSMGFWKPSSSAVRKRSTGWVEVARAPEPRGDSSIRSMQSSKRVMSRRNILA